MVKRTAVILGVLAMLALGAGMSWGYTVCKWPAPGIPNTVYDGGRPCLVGPNTYLRGPVAPACRPPLIPGIIHGAASIPFRAAGMIVAPLFTLKRGRAGFRSCCGPCPLGPPAFVTAAVPCTPVNAYTPPRRW
jgi:hypothetical protein